MVAEDMLGDDWDEWNEQDENEQEGEILTSDEIEGIKDEIKELQRLYDLANSISSNKKVIAYCRHSIPAFRRWKSWEPTAKL